MSALAALGAQLDSLAARRERRPFEYLRPLPGQLALMQCPRSPKLYRAGNQVAGKTTAGLMCLIWRALGVHPYLETAEPPIEAWVICASWSQSLAIQAKLWELVPKDDLDPDQKPFHEVRGFPGHEKACCFANGSIIRFKTTNQGGLNLSGATITAALFDEPPTSQRLYEEVKKRVLKAGSLGAVILTLTPCNAPTDWLRAEAEAGRIEDLHYRLEPENLIPVGSSRPLRLLDGTPMDAAWIEGYLRDVPGHEVGVVAHGEWEFVEGERVFAAFVEDKHVSARLPEGTCSTSFGFDHGDGAQFSQAGYLVAIDDTGTHPRVYVLDEYASATTTTEDDDAREVLARLRRHGMSWRSLDEAFGDRRYPGRRDGASKKSNEELQRALLRLDPLAGRPKIRTVKRGVGRGAGSVTSRGEILAPGHGEAWRLHGPPSM